MTLKRKAANNNGQGSTSSIVDADDSNDDVIPEKQAKDDIDDSIDMCEFEDAGQADEDVYKFEDDSEPESGHSLRSSTGQRLTPSAALKANLRSQRISKMTQETGNISGKLSARLIRLKISLKCDISGCYCRSWTEDVVG